MKKNFTLTKRQYEDACLAYWHAYADAEVAASDEHQNEHTRSLVRGVGMLKKLIDAHKKEKGYE